MRHLCFAVCFVVPAILLQSFISPNRAAAQAEWTVSGGGWIPFLPEYEAVSVVGPGGVPVLRENVFSDDMVDLGGQLRLRGLYHFTGTRTILEAHASIAGLATESGSQSLADGIGSSVWMASLDGTDALSTPDTTSMSFGLDSDVFFNEQYIGLRDRFDLTDWGIGELTIGCGFHHMRFDQDFQFDAFVTDGSSGVYREELDSSFIGGQIVSTLSRRIFGHKVMLDTNVGFYDMNYDYDGRSRLFDATSVLRHSDRIRLDGTEGVTSLDLALRTDMVFSGVLLRPMVGMRYISDMPSIIHPQTNEAPAVPVSLTTESSYFLNFGLEILL